MAAATATKRFSKQTMIEDLTKKLEKLEAAYGFYSCCERIADFDDDFTKAAYGYYCAYRGMLSQIENNDFAEVE